MQSSIQTESLKRYEQDVPRMPSKNAVLKSDKRYRRRKRLSHPRVRFSPQG